MKTFQARRGLALVRRARHAAAPRCSAKAAMKDGEQGLQGRELQEGGRRLRARGEARPQLRRGLVLPRQLAPGAVPPGQGHAGEQGAPRGGHRGLQEVAGDEPGQTPSARRRSSSNTLAALTGDLLRRPLPQLRRGPEVRAAARHRTTPTTPRTSTPWPTSTRSSTRSPRRRRSYKKVPELNPKDAKACGALAGFYNKPNWDEAGEPWVEGSDKPRRAKFDLAIERPRALRGHRRPTTPAGTRRSPASTGTRPTATRCSPTSRRTRTRTRAWRTWTRRSPSSPTTSRP